MCKETVLLKRGDIFMRTSSKGKDLIKKYEGFRSDAYKCPAGVWTIGYGTTRIKGDRVNPGLKISEEEAEELLEDDLIPFETCVSDSVVVPMTQNQFDALISFVYNLGCRTFRRSSILLKMNQGDNAGAANSFLLYDKAKVAGVLKPLKGLTDRRNAERRLFLA